MQFEDREQAGRLLARALMHHAGADVIVLGLPRGGVPVAFQVARALDAPLDVLVTRKIGVPFHRELGMGAIAEGPSLCVNQDVLDAAGISWSEFLQAARDEAQEVRARVVRFRGGAPAPDLRGRTVILVDDGIATGGTTRAAVRSARKRGAGHLVLAVPVASPDVVARLEREVDELVCLVQPALMYAIGMWYVDFTQVSDGEVIALLELARRRTRPAHAPDGPPP